MHIYTLHEINRFFFSAGVNGFFWGLLPACRGRGQTDLRLQRKMCAKRPLLLYYFLLTLLWQPRCRHLSVLSARRLLFFSSAAFSLVRSHSFNPKFPRDAIWGIVKSLRNILNLCWLWSKAFKGWWKAIGLDREGSAVQQPSARQHSLSMNSLSFWFQSALHFFLSVFLISNARSCWVPSPTEIRQNG